MQFLSQTISELLSTALTFLSEWNTVEFLACGIAVILAIPLIRLPLMRFGTRSPKATRVVLQRAANEALPIECANDEEFVYPVKYVSGKHSHSLMRLIPWDASGTISSADGGFRFRGSSTRGQPMDLFFDAEDSLVNYQRGSLLWDGGITWCVIEVGGEKHFFASEVPAKSPEEEFSRSQTTGTLSTGALYQSLTDRYLKNSH